MKLRSETLVALLDWPLPLSAGLYARAAAEAKPGVDWPHFRGGRRSRGAMTCTAPRLNRYLRQQDAMFYFFQRGAEFLQCEIRGDDTSGYEIVITEPKRPERRESFPTSDEAVQALGRASGPARL